MPQNTAPRPICSHCDGFPTVAVTTGHTTPAGERETIPADCPACHGTGHTAPARTHARVGV
ncbi:hypothetical protein ACFYXP_01590 [Streptomyces sp. NPDC002466]|uniref:hypothetical protein n=1 Tax=unclassified Streptomyces TaxID=2593676 RepID=UPI0035E10EBE